jgi:phosphate-selective porin OprO/OprP
MAAWNAAPKGRAGRISTVILALLPLLIATPAVAQSGGDGSGQGSAQGSSGGGSGLTGVPGPYGETLTIDTKGITLQFPDNAAKLRIGGRLQLDYGAVGVSPRGFGPAFDDNFAVRRSWIESYLTLHDVIELAFQYDFANATAPIQDAAIAYHGFEPFLFTVGNFKEPFSLNQLISDNVTLFTERSLADAFAPARNFGGAIGMNGDRWTLVAGVFGGNANTGITDNGVAGTARATYAPILTPTEVLHFGLAGSYRALDRDGQSLSFASRPEAFLFSSSKQLVNTRTIGNAEAVERVGFEAAYQYGPFRVQAEYILTNVDRLGSQPGLFFQGGYIEAGWVLNGRGRPYRLKPVYGSEYAVFTGVEVAEAQRITRGGFGVFELGARFSAIDLSDRTIHGGIERDVTVGLNWYPDRNVRIMADYVHAHAQPSVQLGGRTVNADIFIGRLQFYW